MGDQRIITALLGPTNTGKTHFAVERLTAHANGVIGLPLRLLAREVYDRVVAIKGVRRVALVTGEEKIVPPHADWFVCTVESMPLSREFDFLAVDEIQLCGDADRGHVFTDRLMRARGRQETMFMGADTVRSLIRRLVPEAEITTRPRFSRLIFAGSRKISRLPARSAIVAFSANDVYGLAEQVRRQQGGCAIVMGALSPRTRNAQVALFQNRDVDFLIATDAIGMGLNLDVDHVAFASLRKFDGADMRPLSAAEAGQIAGRAGRHMRDGSFGTTDDCGPMDEDLIERIEEHRFEPVATARWRNTDLNFKNLPLLLRSLDAPAPSDALLRARDAEDYLTLKALAQNGDVAARASTPEATRLLWQCCQIPDFRKTLFDQHVRLVGRIFQHLAGPERQLPTDWVAQQLTQIDRLDGDIDTLMTRIAHIRTWTYVTHQADWIRNPEHWQERSRAIEDRLSDALHLGLTQRFVDRRSAALTRSLKSAADLTAQLEADGRVSVAGEPVGHLAGLSFIPDIAPGARGSAQARAVLAAANRAIGGALETKVDELAAAADSEFSLSEELCILWRGAPVARLTAGDTALTPGLRLIAAEQVSDSGENKAELRLDAWLKSEISAKLGSLIKLRDAELPGAARGIAYQMAENLGAVEREAVADLVRSLSPDDRGKLKALGLRFAETHLFLPALLKPAPTRLKCMLWSLKHGESPVAPPQAGLTSFVPPYSAPVGWWLAAGFALIEARAVRLDMLDRLAMAARTHAEKGAFPITPDLLSLLGCSVADMRPVLMRLGYRSVGLRLPEAAKKPEDAKPQPAEVSAEAVAEAEAGSATPAQVETAPAAEVVASTPEASDASSAAAEAVPVEAQPEEAKAAEAKAEETKADEPKPVEHFARPKRERHQRPRREHRGPRREQAASGAASTANDAATPSAAETAPATGADDDRRGHGQDREQRRERREKRSGKPREENRNRDDREQRRDERPRGPKRFEKRDEREREPRVWSSGAKPSAEADASSPFAKLAALREQMLKGK